MHKLAFLGRGKLGMEVLRKLLNRDDLEVVVIISCSPTPEVEYCEADFEKIAVDNNITFYKSNNINTKRFFRILTEFEIDLFARRNAFVDQIQINQGTWVAKGDLLISLDKGTLSSDLEAAKAELKAAKAAFNDTLNKYAAGGSHESQILSAKADLELNKKNPIFFYQKI